MEFWGKGELDARLLEEPEPRQSAHHIRFTISTLLILFDIAGLCLALAVANFWSTNWPIGNALPGYCAIAAITYFICAFWGKAYNFEVIERVSKGLNRSFAAIVAAISTLLMLWALVDGSDLQAIRSIAIGAACGFVSIVVSRLIFDRFISRRVRPLLFDRVFILDGMVAEIPTGFRTINAWKQGIEPNINDPMMRHWAALFLQDADRVIVACQPERYRQWALFLKGSNVQVEILMPELDELGIVSVSRQGHNTTIGIAQGRLNRRNRIFKRAFDIILAVALSIPAAILILICGIMIKLEDGGPVFFKQSRMGRGNRLFDVFKLRSMTATNRGSFDGDQTQAVTRIGRIIRATSMDELPQLYNVLCGQMSLVGPRPHALESSADNQPFWEVDAGYWQRHAIKPGITGLAQVRGYRGETKCKSDLTNRLNCDLEYLEGWSVWRDLKILAATFRVLVHKNAY